MQIPLVISFDGIPESDAVNSVVRTYAEKLAEHGSRITSCRVILGRERAGGRNLFTSRFLVDIPGETVAAGHSHSHDAAHEDIYIAIRDGFRAAKRQLDEHLGKKRGSIRHAS